MISKNQIKYIRSLESKKGRSKEGAFVAEGPKVVADLIDRMPPKMLIGTDEWFSYYRQMSGRSVVCDGTLEVEVTADELRKVSFLQHPQQVIGVFPIGDMESVPHVDASRLYLALDGVQDPGNLGTIIRIADWFGITQIICSRDTVDVYNPKVVQATMGSIARVDVAYADLSELFAELPADYPVYGTFLDGGDIYREELTPYGIIVMGNEGKGISPKLSAMINRRLLIPNFPIGRSTADSLNVAIATAITCSEFRRR